MRARKLAVVGTLVAAMGLIAAPGQAQTEVVTATVIDGVRALVPGAGVALTGNRTTVSGSYSVLVTETGATGSIANGNGWAVTAALTQFTGTVSGATIGASAVSLLNRDVAISYTIDGGAPGTKDAAHTGAGGDFGTAQTLFEVDGESSGVAYTGTFTGTGDLSMAVPSTAPGDSYTATLTYTLVD